MKRMCALALLCIFAACGLFDDMQALMNSNGSCSAMLEVGLSQAFWYDCDIPTRLGCTSASPGLQPPPATCGPCVCAGCGVLVCGTDNIDAAMRATAGSGIDPKRVDCVSLGAVLVR